LAPDYVDYARQSLMSARADLVDRFGLERLEETAFPVYTNTFPPASYLGWSRIRHAQRLLAAVVATNTALDFGSGLGVMLPYLSQRFRRVVAYDPDPAPTEIMVTEMRLGNVSVSDHLDPSEPFDAVVALDVLEHVEGLDAIYRDLLAATSQRGTWIISGPTENWLYRAMRRLSRTTGEGHVRTIADVFAAVPPAMRLAKVVRLPFGSPVPLFLVGRFTMT
jgi:2-polyprenyl-3-methyl-5-hydroxy-6-metoxy-1,4-benzoquinol methylase